MVQLISKNCIFTYFLVTGRLLVKTSAGLHMISWCKNLNDLQLMGQLLFRCFLWEKIECLFMYANMFSSSICEADMFDIVSDPFAQTTKS